MIITTTATQYDSAYRTNAATIGNRRIAQFRIASSEMTIELANQPTAQLPFLSM